jgi:hypothetical protein
MLAKEYKIWVGRNKFKRSITHHSNYINNTL